MLYVQHMHTLVCRVFKWNYEQLLYGQTFLPTDIRFARANAPLNSFIHKNRNRRYKFLVLGREGPYFVKEHSDSKIKYTEDDIINMLEFLVDNIFVVFGGKVFQQIVGIPMGTNCAPLLADIFFYSYEAEFAQSLLSTGKKKNSISVQLHIQIHTGFRILSNFSSMCF